MDRGTYQTPPGPRWPAISVLHKGVLRYFLDAARYGSVVNVGGDRILVHHPNAIHRILLENAGNYTGGHRSNLIPLIGNGLFLAEGEEWRQLRRRLQPAFHHHRIAALSNTMIETIGTAITRWHNGPVYDMHDEMKRLTLDVLVRCLFGALIEQNTITALAHAFTTIQQDVLRRHQRRLWKTDGHQRHVQHAQQQLAMTIQQIIDSHRQAAAMPSTLVSLLLDAQDEAGQRMDDQQVHAEVRGLLFAGHETTSTALTWTIYLIANHPAVAERLRYEIDVALGSRPPTADDLPQLSYTKAVIEESLRLYSPAWAIPRQAIADDIVDGYLVPARTAIIISPYVTHRNPVFWPNPEVFNPERFLNGSADRPRFAYLPFGGGPRTCIGNGFAMMEMQLIVAMLMQLFTVNLVPRQHIAPKLGLTLQPNRPVSVTLRRRT